ncbi:hypothetical protein KX729_09310 [Rhizobium sp. XQZ8]|uniref:hypothetical protein n=1 Tax=Rhizobium populisoli TaxID=2859785 RepID=UPI001CA4E26F|nr:hypothetical protein [Rhizobium populisoli]MBW6421637.1 hypothetical protein [Rhizobium populisoli]
MTTYTKVTIGTRTVFVPVEQAPQPLPKPAQPKPKAPYAKRIGKKYGERKNWW